MYLYTYNCSCEGSPAQLFVVSPWQVSSSLPVRTYSPEMHLFSTTTIVQSSTISTYTYTPASIGTLGTFHYTEPIYYPVSKEPHSREPMLYSVSEGPHKVAPVRIEFGFLRLIGASAGQMRLGGTLIRGTPQQLVQHYLNYIQTQTDLAQIEKPMI
jgi:hypothetical protein